MKKVVILSIIALMLGAFLSLQIRSFKKAGVLLQRSQPADMLAQLRVFQIANSELRAHLAGEEKVLADMKSKIAKETLDEEINQLRLLSGEEAVFGEGVEFTISAPIEVFWITDFVAQMVSVGAEAVAINDIRLTDETAGFRLIGQGILMRRHFLLPPFKISVIGPKQDLHQSISQNGGLVDRIQKAYPQAKILLQKKDEIIIPALLAE